MSFSQALNYDDGLDFLFDAAKVEFVGGKAKLKLVDNPGQIFSQDFASDSGFTYDAAKAEFVGGVVRQKDQTPADSTFGATFTSSSNGNWGGGVLTGTLAGAAVISGGKADLSAAGNNAIWWVDSGNNMIAQNGAIRFRFTPNYSGSPSNAKVLCGLGTQSGLNNNRILLMHGIAGQMLLYLNSNSGAAIHAGSAFGGWSPTSGTEYEIELNIDCTTGAYRLFINGVLLGVPLTGTCTHDASTGQRIVLGNNAAFDYLQSGKYDDLVLFSTVQHTSNYTPGYVVPETSYAASNVILPAWSYTGVGTIIALESAIVTESGAPRYIVGGYYWNGSTWVASNGTYAQANTSAQVLANLTSLNVVGATTVALAVVFTDSATQSSVDEVSVTLTGQIYPTSDPSILNNSGVLCDALESFAAVSSAAGSDAIKFQISAGGTLKWWNGTAWATSDGTYAQSNTAADILAHCAALDLSAGVTLKVRAVLHSATGSTTPDLTSVALDYSFYIAPVAAPSECLVFGFLKDLVGETTLTNAKVIVENYETFEYNGNQRILAGQKTANVVAGYFEVSLVETASVSKTYHFSIKYKDADGAQRIIQLGDAIVPNQDSVDLADLTFS